MINAQSGHVIGPARKLILEPRPGKPVRLAESHPLLGEHSVDVIGLRIESKNVASEDMGLAVLVGDFARASPRVAQAAGFASS